MSKPNPSAGRARPDGDHWIELGPIHPTPPGQVEVLSRRIYVDPTLADIYEQQQNRPPPPPLPQVSVVEDPPGSGVLSVEVTIHLD